MDYLRNMIQSRPDELSGTAVEAALGIFFVHGLESDVEMVQELAKERPFLKYFVQRAFEAEERRIAPRPGTLESEPAGSHNDAADLAAGEAREGGATTSRNLRSDFGWISRIRGGTVVVLAIATMVILWLILRRRGA